MLLGYIYQMSDGTFHQVRIMAALNIYLQEAQKVIDNKEKVLAKWHVKNKSKK